MHLKTPLYEVWISQGTGMVLGPRFRYLEDARRYIAEHRHGASMAVRSPDGRWEAIAPRARQYSSRSIQKMRATG